MKKKNSYWIKRISCVLVIIGLIALGWYGRKVSHYKQQVREMTFADIDIRALKDGSYEGSCDVDFIRAKVKVLIKDGRIQAIDLLEHYNEKGAQGEQVIAKVLKEQKVDVDVITGATNSSKVIKKAIENSLLKPYPSE